MPNKISIVVSAALLATAFAAGCKKDKKDGAAAASCEGAGAVVSAHMHDKPMPAGLPPDMAKQMEEGMKKVPAAVIKVCSADYPAQRRDPARTRQ